LPYIIFKTECKHDITNMVQDQFNDRKSTCQFHNTTYTEKSRSEWEMFW